MCQGHCLTCEKHASCTTYLANKYDIDNNVTLYEIKVKSPGTYQEPKMY
jgi:hypothetical protein